MLLQTSDAPHSEEQKGSLLKYTSDNTKNKLIWLDEESSINHVFDILRQMSKSLSS